MMKASTDNINTLIQRLEGKIERHTVIIDVDKHQDDYEGLGNTRSSKRKMVATSAANNLEDLRKVVKRMNEMGEEVANTIKELV